MIFSRKNEIFRERSEKKWENEWNRWKMNANFENKRNQICLNDWKKINEMDRTRTMKERKEKKPNGPISNHVKCQILIFFYFLRSLNVTERPRLKIIFFSFKIKNFSYSSFFMQRLKRILNIKIASQYLNSVKQGSNNQR